VNIKRPAYQNGNRTATGWPLQLTRYEASSPPDPADVLDCLIVLNDRTDGSPRTRVVISNGASFDTLAYVTDAAEQPQPIALTTQHVLPPIAQPIALQSPTHFNDAPLRAEIADLRDRVAYLENAIEMLKHWGAVRIKERT